MRPPRFLAWLAAHMLAETALRIGPLVTWLLGWAVRPHLT
jgi:hypothetical protein